MSEVITNNLDLWSSVILNKSTVGRGSNGKQEAYGVKKLRKLILDLAVRGKLVPQDSNDEPASMLLGRIADEKKRLIGNGKIRKQKELLEINEEEKSFVLPLGWEWTKLGHLMEMFNGRAFKSTEWGESGLPIIRIQNLNDTLATFNYFDGELAEQHLVEDGDFLISWSGTPGTSFGAFIWKRGPAALNQHINKCLIFHEDSNYEYLKLAVNSCMDHLISSAQGGVGLKHVTKGTLNNIVFGYPPLAEQHRIVAKVNELMALCDQLEQQQTDSIDAHQTLVETLLGTLTSVESAEELSQAWTRIADHFDTLFTTEHSIDQLKQTILQLAVMGKLVPQDPNDEPISVLLETISKEKNRLLKEKIIRKENAIPEITKSEKRFDIPKEWEWVRLSNLVTIRGGKRVSNGYKLLSEPTPHIYIRVSDMKNGTIDDSDLKYIDEEMYSKISQYIITKDDLYMTIVGATIGKCGLVPDKLDGMNLTENAARLTPYFVSKRFLRIVLSGEFCQSQFVDKTKQVGVQKMALNRLASTVLPLPPLAEQHRIVVKVDELMALCDSLTKRITDAQTTQIHLADAIVEQAVA